MGVFKISMEKAFVQAQLLMTASHHDVSHSKDAILAEIGSATNTELSRLAINGIDNEKDSTVFSFSIAPAAAGKATSLDVIDKLHAALDAKDKEKFPNLSKSTTLRSTINPSEEDKASYLELDEGVKQSTKEIKRVELEMKEGVKQSTKEIKRMELQLAEGVKQSAKVIKRMEVGYDWSSIQWASIGAVIALQIFVVFAALYIIKKGRGQK
jgi:hypothetical protein